MLYRRIVCQRSRRVGKDLQGISKRQSNRDTAHHHRYRQDAGLEDSRRAPRLIFVSMTREKERQRMVRFKAVFRRHWVSLRLLLSPIITLVWRSKKRRNLDLTWARE